MRVLVVKLSSFGDVVHTFPALSDLAAAFPEAEVDWLVEEAFAPLLRLHPAVGAVFTISLRRRRARPLEWPALLAEFRALRRALRARRYDHVVDLQGLPKSAILANLAGVPVAGYDRESARNATAAVFYKRTFVVPRNLHAVERSRRLLAATIGYPLPDSTGRFGLHIADAPTGLDLPADYAVAVHMASWSTKLWPEAAWRRLLESLDARGLAIVLPWGNGEERERAERLADGLAKALVLPRVLDGPALASLLSGARLAIGLDTGLMHLANAFDVPGVWLYGPTDPALSGPYGDRQSVLRSPHPSAPCGQRHCSREPSGACCMNAIAMEAVLAAVAARLHG